MSWEFDLICELEIWAGKQCKYAREGKEGERRPRGFAAFLGKYFAANWHLLTEFSDFCEKERVALPLNI